ncbi:pyrroline-5-carboxylate reductase 2 [Nephila pilipes]|uniref:Pyrroline-5-carboxylate reductase 2 n=1 Tax=Nephila pilipes TaxID=299642 RepID=A0A8X6NW02_NEPPI|nr:pyrroline-5-carboxylate reductase 2 [Nephila pilipes]GFT95407.1 pyrroline-5-carboxylate reductase 2 [Nephila pilipes]GFU17409.1 pyrroline-5-carboxylate reductase 2 [Nephila pilipes]GFU28372.1 pyrroline-5-carboxylate reductase 2 [Nephila pilipes]
MEITISTHTEPRSDTEKSRVIVYHVATLIKSALSLAPWHVVDECANGLLGSSPCGKLASAEKILCSCPRSDVYLLDQMRKLGCRTSSNNSHVASESRIIILAVKPPVIPKVLKETFY